MQEKEKQRLLHNHHPPRKLTTVTKIFTNPTSYVLLLLLSYAFGYLSHRNQSLSPPPPPRQQQQPQSTSNSIFPLSNLPSHSLDNFRVTAPCANSLPRDIVFQRILDGVFNGSSPYANFPPPHVSSHLKTQRIRGWGSYGAVFEHLIERVKPRVIIEVGTFLGASALHMAELTRKHGLQTQILCLDDFRGWPGFRDRFKDIGMINGDVLLLHQFMQNVIQRNATGSVLPVPFSAQSGLEKLCQWGVRGDLIEIDAGHDFLSAWGDINRAYRILRPGGVIFGHDYFTAADNRGVRRAVNLFAQVNNLKVRTDGQHWVIETAS